MKFQSKFFFILIAVLFFSSLLISGSDAALLGNTLNYPLQTFDRGGSIKYNAATDQLSVNCMPVAIRMTSTSFPRFINAPSSTLPEEVAIHITVDSAGNLVGGTIGDDLKVVGAVDIDGDAIIDYSGVLLTGEIEGFGYIDSGGPTDLYDFRFALTGGLLSHLFTGSDIGVEISSENSTFIADFNINFGGGGKGNIGLVAGTASIGDFVWEDLNADGRQGIGEPGIEGVSVRLSWAGPDDISGTTDDIALITTTTGVNGGYLFDNLGSGVYFIDFVNPSGYISSPQDLGIDDSIDSDPDVTTGRTITTTLDVGESDFSWDAGMYQTASIGDYVWNDLNQDGIQDSGETGIDNVTVSLFDCGADNTSGTSDDVLLATTTTDINGFYLFSDLTPGNYYLHFQSPSGFVFSQSNQGIDDALDSDADVLTGIAGCLALSSGENNITVDAGLYIPPTGEIGDYVWNDINSNGIQDSGEPPVGGVVVELYNCGPDQIAGTVDDVLLASTTTDNSGFYLFADLLAGDYFVKFIPSAGYDFTIQDQGIDDGIDSDADFLTGQTVCTSVSAGESNRSLDAGLVQPCTIDVVKTCLVTPPPPSGNDCNGKVTSMIFIYTGEGCSATNNSQDPAKVRCIGGSALTNPVNVIVTNKKDNITYANLQGVPLNGTIFIDASAGGSSTLDSETHIKIYDGFDNSLIEDVAMHTSCSQPLNVGDQFGSLKVAELTTTNGGIVGLPTSTSSTTNCEILASPTASCQGKANVLSLRYLGGDCNATNNWQGGKTLCQDNSIISDPVRIVARSKDKSKTYLDTGSPANVNSGDVVDIIAANGGFSQLESETNVDIYDANGVLAQTLTIHTSCSQPLNLGDIFGSLEVFGMDTTQGGHVAIGTEVEYNYAITNTGNHPVLNVSVIDDVVGEIAGSPIATIAPGETVILTTYSMVSQTTQNTVTVTANPGTSQCIAQATSTVTVQEPPVAPKECTGKIKAILLKYTGPEILGATVKIFADKSKSEPVIYSNVDLIPGVTVLSSPSQNNWTVDASTNTSKSKKKKNKKNELGSKISIYINGVEEILHTSCSTPLSAGAPAPLNNPKGAPSSNWFIEDFIQNSGKGEKKHDGHKEEHHKKKHHEEEHHDD